MLLKRFQAKRTPVRRPQTRQSKESEPFSDSVKSGTALENANDLLAFPAAAEERSFTRAAAQLGFPNPPSATLSA